tara:strand:+ start:374 stop:1138 length:765 start_codon:yes stop_codon:yes gene_type:complete
MTNKIEVAYTSSDSEFWILILGAISVGILLLTVFKRCPEGKKDSYLRRLGIIMITIQCYVPLYLLLDPDTTFSLHRNLPLHFCGINFWLIAFNCFFRSRKLFVFTVYMAIIGGFHSFVTPNLIAGYSFPTFINYIFVHSGLIFVPIIMMRHYGMKLRSFDWIRAYGFNVLISTLMIGINTLLNVYLEPTEGAAANYMYVMEQPDVQSPFLSENPVWPFYMFPLHIFLIIHMLILNAIIRWRSGVKLTNWFGFFR